MKKWLLKLAIFVLVLITPIVTLFGVTEALPNAYEKTYLAALNDKFNNLNKDNKKKIVFVGDSAMPFGLKCEDIEKALDDYRVVDFGLYGTIGTKFMLDISKSNIQPGDIYIVSPGISKQTYSLYFNAETILQACDGNSSIYRYLGWDDNWDLVYHYYGFAKKKIGYIANNDSPDPIGIYRHDSFDEYGDIKVDRPENIMVNGYDEASLISMDDSLLNTKFIDYVNEYCNYVRSKGAKVYFNFAPCNQKAVTSTKKARLEFQEKLSHKLQCDLLTDINDIVLNSGYFYDTNAHLNSTGVTVYTNLMIRNLKLKLGITSDKESDNPLPPGQTQPEVIEPEDKEGLTPFAEYKGEPNNDYLDWFEYKANGSIYEITGVKTKYKGMTEVILPSTYNHKNIASISSNAFAGCVDLKTVHIGKTYQTLKEASFGGAISLEKIYFYEMDGNSISIPSTGLFDGTNRDVKVYIPTGSNYPTGYTWANYLERLVYYE